MDRPIIFSAPMVRALLDGRKTQTRRVLHPQPWIDGKGNFCSPATGGATLCWGQHPGGEPCVRHFIERCVRFAVGDRLWVKESWRTLHKWDCLAPRNLADDLSKITFEADPEHRNPLWAFGKIRPSIFMPRWASRLTLTVTGVRVERLRDISEADAETEGMPPPYLGDADPPWEEQSIMVDRRRQFRNLWNSLHGPKAWDANPWVAAITFMVQRGNLDSLRDLTVPADKKERETIDA